MVNFRDPVIAGKDYLVLKSLYHTTCGIYLWEYFTTLHYELDVMRGHRPYRWTIWVYSLSRMATLMAVVLNFVDLNVTTPINCQVWITFEVVFGYLGIAAASLLIVIRIVAIWNKDKIAVAIATSLWVTNVVVITQSKSSAPPSRPLSIPSRCNLVSGIARLHAEWNVLLPGCIVFNSHSSKLNIIVTLIVDIILLLVVLVGLLRWRSDGLGMFGISRLLWEQGVTWLLLATVAEVPPTVLIVLNLNDPLNLMFQLPSVITMSIAATRMHRSLTDFVSGTTDIEVSKLQWNEAPCDRIEVTVDTSFEQYQMP